MPKEAIIVRIDKLGKVRDPWPQFFASERLESDAKKPQDELSIRYTLP